LSTQRYSLYSKLFVIASTVCLMLFVFGFTAGSGYSVQASEKNPVNAKIKPLASMINSIKSSGKLFKPSELFNVNASRETSSFLSGYLRNFTSLKIDAAAKEQLLSRRPESIVFRIPNGSSIMELELTRVNVLTDDFKSGSLSGNGTVTYSNYTPGVYYRGIIKGDNESFASLSVFSDFVMAVASNGEGNWNLSSVKGANTMYSENYVFYNDASVINRKDFTCGVNDESGVFDKRSSNWSNNSNSTGDNVPPQLVRKYFECDFKMYQDFGNSIVNVGNYVTGFFNSCAAVYAQDSINTSIQQVLVWTSADPYLATTDNEIILKMLGGRLQNSFNGDLAHFISTRTDISGGIAWIGVLCSPFNAPDSSGRYGVSVIENTYQPFPQYSWTVNVVVHEMGHNLGSNHTHNCSWPGGPIDSCFTIEGGCYSGPQIPKVGTIMSYCHLNASVNLSLGFGPLPGDTIRAHVRRANCLTIGISPIGSEVPAQYMLQQNYPNPFNPVTNIKFSIPKTGAVKLTIFDVSGREVAVLVNESLAAGSYNADFDAAGLSSGVYLYKLESDGFVQTKKMVLIK